MIVCRRLGNPGAGCEILQRQPICPFFANDHKRRVKSCRSAPESLREAN